MRCPAAVFVYFYGDGQSGEGEGGGYVLHYTLVLLVEKAAHSKATCVDGGYNGKGGGEDIESEDVAAKKQWSLHV